MTCEAHALLAAGAHLADLPPHTLLEHDVNLIGQEYVLLRYDDGSVDLIDPVPW